MPRRRRYPKRAKRRIAPDGIKARSRRGGIGESWWSRRFLAALESLTDSTRLTRGRSYARSGQVLDLEVEPGLVTALVQGSRRHPYQVEIEVTRLTADQWSSAEDAMADQALFLAQLLAGDIPHDIETAFTAAGLSLFPSRPEDLRSSCSCPDWANPCKHVAATFYLLAEAFDADPFLTFLWRGRAQEELLGHLQELRARAPSSLPDDLEDDGGPPMSSHRQLESLPTSRTEFWRPGRSLDDLRFLPRVPLVPDALLRQLGPGPLKVRGEPIENALAAAYRELTAAAERRAREG